MSADGRAAWVDAALTSVRGPVERWPTSLLVGYIAGHIESDPRDRETYERVSMELDRRLPAAITNQHPSAGTCPECDQLLGTGHRVDRPCGLRILSRSEGSG